MAKAARRRRRSAPWAEWPSERLLDLRLSDLAPDLCIEHSEVWPLIEEVQEALERKELEVAPHFWFADEWFSPEAIPGVAVPFYLGHPRLRRLEREMMLEVEGGDRSSAQKLLRHELGHVIQHAYRLGNRRGFHRLFGRPSQVYPDTYHPNPSSRDFVQHLDGWYAQSHPEEDFAETFAVWLAGGHWRRRYATWPALSKLEYVDELMRELAGVKPLVKSRARPYAISTLRMTLRDHYANKRQHGTPTFTTAYDPDLRRMFADAADERGAEPAVDFVGRNRGRIRRMVARWSGEYVFTVDQVIDQMMRRCDRLGLHLVPRPDAAMDFAVLLTVHAMGCLYRSRQWHQR